MTWLCMSARAALAWAGITSLIMAEGKFTPSDFRSIIQCNGASRPWYWTRRRRCVWMTWIGPRGREREVGFLCRQYSNRYKNSFLPFSFIWGVFHKDLDYRPSIHAFVLIERPFQSSPIYRLVYCPTAQADSVCVCTHCLSSFRARRNQSPLSLSCDAYNPASYAGSIFLILPTFLKPLQFLLCRRQSCRIRKQWPARRRWVGHHY